MYKPEVFVKFNSGIFVFIIFVEKVGNAAEGTCVRLYPFPDLSNHVVTVAPFDGTVPLFDGSVASYHVVKPATEYGEKVAKGKALLYK